MGYAKERGKFEQLVAKIAGIKTFNEKSLTTLIDIHEKYSHTVRILKNKEPETFGPLYKNELEEVKAGKKAVKESDSDEARQSNFDTYKAIILKALEKTISTTKETL